MTTTLANSNPLSTFNVAQTFFIDPALAPNNDVIGVSSINVYFQYKPAPNAANTTGGAGVAGNISGLANPGVTMYLCGTLNGVPQMTANSLAFFARCEYNQIQTSSDGSVATNFHFNQPVLVQPGQEYAFVLSYDGNEQFVPWTATSGYQLVGSTNTFSAGFSTLIGSYFEFASNAGNSAGNQYLSNWNDLQGTSITFDVMAARYYIESVPVASSNAVQNNVPIFNLNTLKTWDANTNTYTLYFPMPAPEGIAFEISTSTVQSFIGAQKVYQNTVSYPGGPVPVTVSCNGSVIVVANTTLPNGVAFNWNNIYPSFNQQNMIVLIDSSGVDVRRVVGISNTTCIALSEPTTFTNSAATFMISPIATLDTVLESSPFGTQDNFLYLLNSTANSTVRFVNNSILLINATAGGTSYSNSDVLYITGYEYVSGKVTGGYIAIANISTNSTGGIVNTYMSNLGCGFVYSGNIVAIVANSTSLSNTTGNTSSGSGATFAYTIGSTLCTESTPNIFQNCIVCNFNIDDVLPFANISNPIGTTYDAEVQVQYIVESDSSTFANVAYYAITPQVLPVSVGQLNQIVSNTPVAFISYSNEWNTQFSNGAGNNTLIGPGSSNGFVFITATELETDSDFLSVTFNSTPSLEFGHYIINDSYAAENTNSGNAWAKHLTTLINFNQFAEDIRVYLTAYQPINTGFEVYAKIQNSNDPEAFSNEDWTRLQLISGQGLVSSLSNPTDYVELGYGFQLYPNTSFTVNGSITTTNNSTTVSGVNTAFSSVANITANNIVRIYSPLFSNTEYIVASVTAVANDTQLTIDQAITSNVDIGGNPGLVGAGLSMDVISYPYQAWNNINNDNVVRYYNTSIVRFDGYNTLQLKVVLLSSAMSYIPQLNSIRAIGVSA
jgi:hypothetical protein